MHNSSFKNPRKPLARNTPLRAKKGFTKKVPIKRTKTAPNGKNKPIKTISTPIPKWLKAIPESKAHGSGTYQQRYWKLTSDYVRIRDWHEYGVCTATGKRLESWKEGHAGHLKPYSTCNALFKFDLRNIHLQHGNSNKFGNFDTFRDFEKEVKRRGYDWDLFEKENQQASGSRLYDSEVIEKTAELLELMKDLPEQPDYFERAYTLYKSLT